MLLHKITRLRTDRDEKQKFIYDRLMWEEEMLAYSKGSSRNLMGDGGKP
jgi:hypothetical protein